MAIIPYLKVVQQGCWLATQAFTPYTRHHPIQSPCNMWLSEDFKTNDKTKN